MCVEVGTLVATFVKGTEAEASIFEARRAPRSARLVRQASRNGDAAMRAVRRRNPADGEEEALRAAIQSGDVERLSRVIATSKAAGANSELIERADRRLMLELRICRDRAPEELRAAIESAEEDRRGHLGAAPPSSRPGEEGPCSQTWW